MARQFRKNFVISVMESKGLKQVDLAGLTGLSDSAVSRYLSGDSCPSSVSTRKISNALGIPINDLVGDKPDLEFDEKLYRAVMRRKFRKPKQSSIKIVVTRLPGTPSQCPFYNKNTHTKGQYKCVVTQEQTCRFKECNKLITLEEELGRMKYEEGIFD